MKLDYEIVTSGGVYYPGRRIETKRRMYQLLQSGQLGNAWPSIDGVKFDGHWASQFYNDPQYKGFAIRTSHKNGGGGPFLWGLSCREVVAALPLLSEQGYVCNVSPTDEGLRATRVAQGYFYRQSNGLLYFNEASISGNLREGFEKWSRHLYARDAYFRLSEILREDYDWVVGLTEKFTGAVVEFTTYAAPLGTEHKRTVIWEVRHY